MRRCVEMSTLPAGHLSCGDGGFETLWSHRAAIRRHIYDWKVRPNSQENLGAVWCKKDISQLLGDEKDSSDLSRHHKHQKKALGRSMFWAQTLEKTVIYFFSKLKFHPTQLQETCGQKQWWHEWLSGHVTRLLSVYKYNPPLHFTAI